MTQRTIAQQLTKYLADVHSIEVQAVAQLERAPSIAGDEQIAAAFREHLEETLDHERKIRARLKQRGEGSSPLKDTAGRVGGWAMIAFARLNPDTPGKLTVHAFSYEHMEVAAYELLARVAQLGGDVDVLETARQIVDEERAMAGRLEANFDRAAEASLRDKNAGDLEDELVSYLRDAHAIESQATQLLEAGTRLAGSKLLADAFQEHLEQTREHRRTIESRLTAHGSHPSAFQSTALRVGGLNIGAFFGAQPDTPVKLAGFAFAFEHLEIAAYELLRRIAARAGDGQTATDAQRIASEERAAATRIATSWDSAVDAALEQMGVAPAA
jgi:ferritin-like metal-binding protein YciE